MVTSRWRISAALVLLVLAGCAKHAAAPGPAGAPARAAPFPITVQLDWVAEPEHGGFYQAQARGFFRAAGLDVTIVPGGPNGFVLQKVATGKADLGQSDSTNVLLAINQGLPIIQVAAVFQHDPSVLMLHADNPVRTFAELNGKTIMARPEWAFLPYLRKKYHIDFSIVPQNFSVGNFIADRNFIQQGFYIAEPYHIVQGGAKYPKFLYAWDAGFDAYTVVVANRSWAAAHAPQLRAFLAAYIHGWRDYLAGDPAPGNALMRQVNPNNTEDFMAFERKQIIADQLVVGRGAPADDATGRITRARFANQIHQLEELSILPAGKLTPDQVMTTAYLP